MKALFEYDNYRIFLKDWLESPSGKKRGERKRLAEAAKVSPTLISLVLAGRKELSSEQAADITDYLGLSESEADFFSLLLQRHRAGTANLRAKLDRKIARARKEALKISNRAKNQMVLDEATNALFYSSWFYAGVRNLCAISGLNERNAIAKYLQLELEQVDRVLDFLLEHGLLKKTAEGLAAGPAHMHLDASSPFVGKHHQNWRLRGFSKMDLKRDSNLFYSCPMSLSQKDAEKVRALLPDTIGKVLKIIEPSPSEEGYCLNIDWFQY